MSLQYQKETRENEHRLGLPKVEEIKITVEINEIKARKTIENISIPIFLKDKSDKLLKRDRIHINKIRNKRGEVYN